MDRILRNYVQTVAKTAVVVLMTALVGCGGMLLLPGPTGDRPQIQGVYPIDGATGVPLNATVQATFNKSMDEASINASTFTLSVVGVGATPSIKAVEGSVSYVAATRTAVLTPATDLSGFTFYTATVSGDVQDTSGNTMGEDYTWQFRTSDQVAPDVESTDPADGETDLENVPEVTVTFTEDVNEDTVDGSSFRLNKGAELVTGSVDASGDTATFTPAAALECSSTYTGLVTTAIEDLSGNRLASNYAWTFSMAPGRWARSYDAVGTKDDIRSIAETNDGGYIVAGTTNNVIGAFQSAWIAKLDASGDPEWQKAFGDATDDDSFESVQQTADGGYVAAGGTHLGGLGDLNFWVVKFSADGVRQWETIYGGALEDTAHAIQELAAGGYIVVGTTNSFGAGNLDVYYTFLNAAGAVTSTMTVGTAGNDYAYSVQQTTDGGYIVAGATGNDYWLIKINNIGNVSWESTYGGASSDIAYSVRQTAEGGFIVLGHSLSFGAGQYDMWALKTDKDGLLAPPGPDRWQYAYGGASNDHGFSVIQTSDGGYMLAGITQSFGLIREDGWLVKIDSTGGGEWANRYGNAGFGDFADQVIEKAGGGYAFGGRREHPTTVNYDAWVLDLDLTGGIDASCTEVVATGGTRTVTAVVPGFTGVSNAPQAWLVGAAASTEVDTSATEETQCQSPCAPLTP